ncbi:MAG: signal peptidase II [Verrucomicrobiota bacterium]
MLKLILCLSLPLYILDQWSKNWIVAHFDLHGREQEVIQGTFWLHHIANRGVAFGMFNGTQYANYVFTVVSLSALAFLIWGSRTNLFPGKLSRVAVALLVSGILGNLTDRLFRREDDGVLFGGGFLKGYVVDFLRFDFGFPPFNPWPSFNVADSCVVVAAVMLAIASFVEAPPQKTVVKG